MAGLTIKQEKFCQRLFAGLSQREAYKQAFNSSRMKDKTIDEVASKLAKEYKVATRLKELTDELKERNIITIEQVLAEYKKIAFADIKDFLEYKTIKTDLGYTQVIDAKDSNEIDGTMVNEVSISRDGTFKFKLHDKKGALDQIGKHLGMFVDKLEVNGNMVIFNGEKELED